MTSNREELQRERDREDRDRQCQSRTGGGRYRCCLDTGHAGRHRAGGTFTTWTDPEPDTDGAA